MPHRSLSPRAATTEPECREIFRIKATATHRFWHTRTSVPLYSLLQQCQYPEHVAEAYLAWYNDEIIPTLGAPSISCRPLLTHSGSSMEPSVNYTANKTTVRFTIEPVGGCTDTTDEVAYQEYLRSLMQRLKTSVPNLDLTWFDHFANRFFVLAEKTRDNISHRTLTCFLAFDLAFAGKPQITPKAYLFPKSRAYQEGLTTGKVVIDAIRSLPFEKDKFPSLEIIANYFRDPRSPQGLADVEMLGMDCGADPTKRTLKIYSHSFHNSFEKVVRIYTLDGRVPNEGGVKQLAKLWQIVFEDYLMDADSDWDSDDIMNDDDDDDDWKHIELPHYAHPRSCMVFSFEIQPGSSKIDIKVYLPLWWYSSGSDSRVSEKLGKYFKNLGPGFEEVAGEKYVQRLKNVFAPNEYDVANGTHTYFSFAYSEAKGLYVTPYYASNAHEIDP